MNDFYRQGKSQEKLFFSRFALSNYDVFAERGYNRLIDLFQNEMVCKNNLRILDLGCGSGAFTRHLLKLNGQIFGLDISYDLIRGAENKDKIRFVLGDLENLPFANDAFDVVVFSGVLHHFPSLRKPVKEAYRILKKNGQCFAYDPNNRNPIMWIFRNKKSPFYYSGGITPNERLLTKEEIEAVFSSNGFLKIKVLSVSGIPYRYVHNRIMRMFLPIYNFLDYIFSKIYLSYRYGSFLLTIAQK